MILFVDNSVTERELFRLQMKHSLLNINVEVLSTARRAMTLVKSLTVQVDGVICDWMLELEDEPFRDVLILTCQKMGIPVCVFTASPDSVNRPDVTVFDKGDMQLPMHLMEWLSLEASKPTESME